jgi:RNA exonuclease 1
VVGHSVVGHDSCVDASASMELVKLKLARGPDFGLYFPSTESIFSRLERCRPSRHGAVIETLGSIRPSPFTQHAKASKRCDNDEQLVDEVIEATGCYDFIWASLHGLPPNQPTFESRFQPPVSPTLTAAEVPESKLYRSSTHLSLSLSRLDGYVQKIWSCLPVGTVLVVIGSAIMDDRVR